MSEGGFHIRFAPYTFRGASRPHGLEWRLFGPENKLHIEAGLVFGDLEVMKAELPAPFDEWAKAGKVEMIEVETFKIPEPPTRPRRPTGNSDVARRIYEARFAAYLKAMRVFNRMKGPEYV